MICVYNEPDWIIPSILSIKDVVNEFIVIDSSTDETSNYILELKDKYSLNMKYIRMPVGDLVKARNTALTHVSYKWVLVWDADFIARPEFGRTLKEVLDNLDEKYYYLIYWPHIQICGDLKHTCPKPYHIEHWMYTWSEKAYYRYVDRFESLIAPVYMYRAIMIDKPISYHLRNVRNPKRLAIKNLWWMFKKEYDQLGKKGYDLEKFAKEKARKIYGTDNLEQVGLIMIKKMIKNLPRYDPKIYGEYPKLLLEYIKGNPRLRMLLDVSSYI